MNSICLLWFKGGFTHFRFVILRAICVWTRLATERVEMSQFSVVMGKRVTRSLASLISMSYNLRTICVLMFLPTTWGRLLKFIIVMDWAATNDGNTMKEYDAASHKTHTRVYTCTHTHHTRTHTHTHTHTHTCTDPHIIYEKNITMQLLSDIPCMWYSKLNVYMITPPIVFK